MHRRFLLSAFVLVLLSAACHRSQPPGWGSHTVTWGNAAAKDSLLGVDSACIAAGMWGDEPAIVLWGDCAGSFSASFDRKRDAVYYEGTFRTESGYEFDAECFATGKNDGTAEIDGEHFDLSLGSLFLITQATGKIKIKQLRRTVVLDAGVESEAQIERLSEFARNDSQLVAFFQRSNQNSMETP